MASVFLDGRFVGHDDAKVSAFDAGLQHGVGLFETMLAIAGSPTWRILHLHEHLERLRQSAKDLGLSDSLRTPALAEAIERTVAQAAAELPDSTRLRVRLTITGGDLNLLNRGPSRGSAGASHQPSVLIAAQPATEYPSEMFARGVLVTLADMKANPFDATQGHKTLNYWGRLRELQIAAAKNAGEALIFSVTNHLAGACVSNVFIAKDGVLMTPIARGEEEGVASGEPDMKGIDDDVPGLGAPKSAARGAVLPSPVLPGIVRRWVLDWALAEGIETRRRMLTLDDVLRADEVFLTNSSWGVLPVVRLEAEKIAAGSPGPLSTRLVGAWSELAGEDDFS